MLNNKTLALAFAIMVIMATCSNAKYFREDSSESESQELREDVLARLFERAFARRQIHSFST